MYWGILHYSIVSYKRTSTMTKQVTSSSETSLTTYKTTRHHNTKNYNPNMVQCLYLKFIYFPAFQDISIFYRFPIFITVFTKVRYWNLFRPRRINSTISFCKLQTGNFLRHHQFILQLRTVKILSDDKLNWHGNVLQLNSSVQ